MATPAERQAPGAEESDAEMRALARREAVEVLAHQLRVERVERARVHGRETLLTAGVFGIAFGSAWAASKYLRRGGRRRGR